MLLFIFPMIKIQWYISEYFNINYLDQTQVHNFHLQPRGISNQSFSFQLLLPEVIGTLQTDNHIYASRNCSYIYSTIKLVQNADGNMHKEYITNDFKHELYNVQLDIRISFRHRVTIATLLHRVMIITSGKPIIK